MLHKVKLDVEDLFMVKKGLTFTENVRRQILLINSKGFVLGHERFKYIQIELHNHKIKSKIMNSVKI